MQKIKNFLISNYSEILSVSSIFIIFFLLIFTYWNHFGLVVIDCGREVYLPQEILKGKVLYKDLFNFYGPLSYLINACVYKILGISLDALRIAGTINASITIFLLYFIARLFTSKKISWVVTIFIMINCAFRVFNYVFPYAYAMSYAFCAFLFSVLFILLYLKTSKQYFMPLSWFFIGVSIASKTDYVLYMVFLASLTGLIKYYKRVETKYIIYSLILFLIVPLGSFTILFLQGLTFNELLTQVQIIKKFAFIPSNIYFQMSKVGLYPQKHNLIVVLKYFTRIFPSFMFLMASFYFVLKFSKTIIKTVINFIIKSTNFIINLAIQFINFIFNFIINLTKLAIVIIKFLLKLSVIGILFYNLFPMVFKEPALIQSYVTLFSLFVFAFMFYRIVTNKKYSYEITYAVYFLIALIISFKAFFFLNYGTYTMEFAFAFILFSILFLIFYLRTSKQYFIVLCWIFSGFSIAFDNVYLWFIIIPAFLTILAVYRKKLDSKYLFYCLILFLMCPAVFYSNIDKFYPQTNKLVFGFDYLHQIFINFSNLAVILAGAVCYSLKLIKLPKFAGIKIKKVEIKKIKINNLNYENFTKFDKFNKIILSVILLGVLLYTILLDFLKAPDIAISWLPLFTMFIICFMLLMLIKDKKYTEKGIYLAFLMISFLAALKSLFFLNMNSYGAFTFPLLFIANVVLIVEYLPDKIKFIDKKTLQQAFFLLMFGITLICYKNLIAFYDHDNVLKAERGSVSDLRSITAATQETIDYIKKNLKPKDSIWVIPEGVMINFLTNHPANGFYYSTIPPYIETFGEEKIISDIKTNPPDYVIINDRDTSEYNFQGICKDYGQKICKWVNSSYIQIKSFSNTSRDKDEFKLILYKKKQIIKS